MIPSTPAPGAERPARLKPSALARRCCLWSLWVLIAAMTMPVLHANESTLTGTLQIVSITHADEERYALLLQTTPAR